MELSAEEMRELIERLKNKVYDLQEKNRELSDKLRKEREVREGCEFRIRSELEPRIRREKASYDAYVLTDHAAEAAESFSGKVDELIEMVKENPAYFVWGSKDDDIYSMVLYLIGAEINEELREFCITDR